MQVRNCLELCMKCCVVLGQGGQGGQGGSLSELVSRILGSLNVGGPGAGGPPGLCYCRVLWSSRRDSVVINVMIYIK